MGGHHQQSTGSGQTGHSTGGTGSGSPPAGGGSGPSSVTAEGASITLGDYPVEHYFRSAGAPLAPNTFVFIRRLDPQGPIYRVAISGGGAGGELHRLQGGSWEALSGPVYVSDRHRYAVAWKEQARTDGVEAEHDGGALNSASTPESIETAMGESSLATTPGSDDMRQHRLIVAHELGGAAATRNYSFVYPTPAWDLIDENAGMMGPRLPPIQLGQYFEITHIKAQLEFTGQVAAQDSSRTVGRSVGTDSLGLNEQYTIWHSQVPSHGSSSDTVRVTGGDSLNLSSSRAQLTAGELQVQFPAAHLFSRNVTFNVGLSIRLVSVSLSNRGVPSREIGVVVAKGDVTWQVSRTVIEELEENHLIETPRTTGRQLAWSGSVKLKLEVHIQPDWRAIFRQLGIQLAEDAATAAISIAVGVAGAGVILYAFYVGLEVQIGVDNFILSLREAQTNVFLFCWGYVHARVGVEASISGQAYRNGRDAAGQDIDEGLRQHPGGADMRDRITLASRQQGSEQLYRGVFGALAASYKQRLRDYYAQQVDANNGIVASLTGSDIDSSTREAQMQMLDQAIDAMQWDQDHPANWETLGVGSVTAGTYRGVRLTSFQRMRYSAGNPSDDSAGMDAQAFRSLAHPASWDTNIAEGLNLQPASDSASSPPASRETVELPARVTAG